MDKIACVNIPGVDLYMNWNETSSIDIQLHGILNAVSWGVLFPLGIMVARYLRTFESAEAIWFYLHVGSQFCSYAIGVGGWATGLRLGAESKGIQFTSHRIIGMILFSLSTLQVDAS